MLTSIGAPDAGVDRPSPAVGDAITALDHPRADGTRDQELTVDATPPGPDAFAGRPRVWIVGDSLAVGAGTPAQSMMGGRYDVTVRALVGASISNRYPEVVAAVAAGAHAIVIQAGINDVGGGTANVTKLTYDIGRSLDATLGTLCTYWVTYQSKFTGTYQVLSNAAPTLNGLIRSEVAQRSSWAHVIEFQPYIDAHPELNAPDGLHLTAAGYQDLAQFYADGLRGCFGF